MACPHYSTRSTRGRPTPLRFGHLRRDAQRLRAVLRCDTGIATNAHGTTTAMRGRCRRRRPADSRATQSSHLPGTPGRRAPEARRTWKRSRRALQQRCAPFGARPGSVTVLQSTAGSTGRSGFRLDASLVGHAVCRSAAGGCQHCPRPAVAAAAACHQRRGPSARPRTRPRRGRRAEPPAAASPGVAVACMPWAPVGPADRTGSGQEQKKKLRQARRCRLVVFGVEVGGRINRTPSCDCSPRRGSPKERRGVRPGRSEP